MQHFFFGQSHHSGVRQSAQTLATVALDEWRAGVLRLKMPWHKVGKTHRSIINGKPFREEAWSQGNAGLSRKWNKSRYYDLLDCICAGTTALNLSADLVLLYNNIWSITVNIWSILHSYTYIYTQTYIRVCGCVYKYNTLQTNTKCRQEEMTILQERKLFTEGNLGQSSVLFTWHRPEVDK